MTTKAELIAWLKNPNSIRVLLAEIQGVLKPDGSTQNFYLSNKPFVSRSTDVPANTSYTAAISGGITFSESISLDGTPSIGFGDVSLNNPDNQQNADAWLNYVWANKPISILIGDATWPRQDFYQIFAGVVKDIDSSDRNNVNLILVNRLEKINIAISETKVGGTGTNADQLVPLTFGECFNVTPVLVDAAQLIYQVHNGPIESIIEVRDNGAPLTGPSAPTLYLSEGKFKLAASPFGTITASVQGYKKSGGTYQSKVGSVISNILLDYATAGVSYNIVASTVSANEGDVVTFTLNTSGVAQGTVIPYTITGVTSQDISGASLTGNFPAINNNTAQVSFTIAADATTEGPETLTLSLTNVPGVSSSITIQDTSVPVTATITPSANTVNEGSSVTFTVNTQNFPTGTLYWTTNLTNATAADFSDGQTTGTVTISNSTGTITRTIVSDATTEAAAESFTISVRTDSITGTILATSSSVTIADTSQTPVSPTVTWPSQPTSINENATTTFNVTTTNIANGTTLYWTIANGTTTNADFSATSGSFTITSNAGSFSVTTSNDLSTEGSETFTIQVRTGSTSGTVIGTSSTITIQDTSVAAQTVTWPSQPTSINENTTTTFNVTTSGVTSGTTLYWTIANGTTTNADFSATSGSFTITSNAGSFSVTTSNDLTTEGSETFTIQIRTGSTSGTIIGTSSTITIQDTSVTAQSASFTTQPTSINENATTTYAISTTGVASNSTLYWTINHGTTVAADFSATSGSFVLSGTTGSFNITTSNDLVSEAAETFSIQIRTGSTSGTVIGTSSTITISGIITTGLAFEVDARNTASYPGTGTTWASTVSPGTTTNVTLVGGPTFTNSDGISFFFDGADDRGTTTNKMYGCRTINTGTIEGWIKPQLKTTSANYQRLHFLFGTRDVQDATPAFYIILFDGSDINGSNFIEARIRLGKSTQSFDIGTSYNWTALVNTWSHLAFVRNSTTATLYLNGTQIAQRTDLPTNNFDGSGGGIAVATESEISAFAVGFDVPNAGFAARGNIALVRSYTAALTQAQVQNNFNVERARFGV